MHEQDPPVPITGDYHAPGEAPRPVSAPAAAPKKTGWNRAGGVAIAVALFAAKAKVLLTVLLGLKWFLLGGKLLLSFSTIFVSIWFYALAFGWKLGVVFVLLILVHEMGHWVVLRGFGIPVSLPYFIPGLGAFVAQKASSANNVQDAAAAIAGPGVGIAASAICQAYGVATGNPFWIVAAHLGYLINLFNLIPVLPLDGGRIAGTIDPRLWMLGLVVFVAYIASTGLQNPVAWLFLIIIGVTSIPRAIAAWRGVVDPRVRATPPTMRAAIAAAYFLAIAFAAVGAAQTAIAVPT